MFPILEHIDVPMPITFDVDDLRDETGQLVSHGDVALRVATSPQWPGLRGVGENVPQAVTELLCQIGAQVPLTAATVEALTAAGHGPEVVAAWDEHVRGETLRAYRNAGDTASRLLADYDEHGVPAVEACGFLAAGLSPEDAGTLRAAGIGAAVAQTYADRLAYFDDGIFVDRAVAEWALAGIAPQRAHFYERNGVLPEEAQAWEDLMQADDLSDEDLLLFIEAGMSPEEVRANAVTYAGTGITLTEAARMVIALQTPLVQEPLF